MSNKKHYIITSITLASIAAGSGLLIGLANLVTKDQIKKNEKIKINNGIVEIFGKTAIISEDSAVNNDNYKHVERSYLVKDDTDKNLGYAFRTTNSNMYGKISLIAGFDEATHGFIGISIVVNEQTYATTLEDNYIDPLNDGKIKLDDVDCGATYGAKLIRELVNEAKLAAEDMWKE